MEIAPSCSTFSRAWLRRGPWPPICSDFYQLYKQVESWSVLFGIQLGEIVQFLDQFIEMQVTPLIGLPLTVGGLGLLLAGSIVRLASALLEWNHRR